MNDEELIPSLDSGLEALIAEFNGFAAANQNSPAYGSPKAARDTAVMLRSCLVLSRKLKSLSTDEILGNDPQSSKYRTFDIVKFAKKMSRNRTEELKSTLNEIETLLDGKLSITNWKIEAFGFPKDIVQGHGHFIEFIFLRSDWTANKWTRDDQVQAIIQRIFLVLCPIVGRALGNILIVYLSLFQHEDFVRHVLYIDDS